MRSIFSRAAEKRASASGPRAQWDTDVERLGTGTAAGVTVSADSARMLAAVWACQSLIADGISSLPIDTFRVMKGKRTNLDNPAWLERPNPYQTRYTFLHQLLISLLGEDGNAFIFIVRNDRGEIASLIVLDPKLVTIDEFSASPLYYLNGVPYTDRDILHIPAFVVPGYRRGLSVIDHAREAIGLGLAAEEYGARFFSQGTTMSGVVEHPGTPKPGEVAILGKMLRKSHAGLRNSHAVGILTGGATWKSISITPEQAQFLETRRFQNIEIAKLYRVPPHLIDPSVSSSWGTGIEEQNSFFVDYTLIPWLVRIEQAISTFLLPNGQYMKFNVNARLRAKMTERFAAYVQAITNGLMSLDEARALEDMEPIPGGLGKAHFMPSNTQELGKDPPLPADTPPADPADGDPPPKKQGKE